MGFAHARANAKRLRARQLLRTVRHRIFDGRHHGQWNDVWDSFNKRRTAKNGPAANQDAGELTSDMFSAAGIAAE